MDKKTADSLRVRSNSIFQIPSSVRIFSFILSVTLTTGGVGYYLAFAANTVIGNNISTSGSLTVGGTTTLNTIAYTWPSSDGTSGQVLSTNGTGGLSWASDASGTVNSGLTGQLSYYAADGTTLAATSSIFLATNGNVGIGSASPTSKLHVVGDVRIEDGTQAAGYVLTSDAAGLASWMPVSAGISGSGTTNKLTKWTAPGTLGDSLITDDSAGISATLSAGSPGGSFTVAAGFGSGSGSAGNINLTAGAKSTGAVVAGSANLTGGQGESPSTGGSATVKGGNGSGSLAGSANVIGGTGSTSGGTGGSVNITGGPTSTGANTAGSVIISSGSGTNPGIIALRIASAEKARLHSNGNFGIGTTSPSQLLSVHGNALFSGDITSVANITATGTLFVNGTAAFGNNVTVGGNLILPGNGGTSLQVQGTATSTFAGGLEALALNITSSSATSTFANGLQLSAGCFRMPDGSCAGAGGATINSGLTGQFPYYAADGTALTATSSLFVSTAGNVGIGTTTPNYNFTVAGKTIAFNANQDGTLSTWSTNSNALPAVRYYHSSVIANGYAYVIGGTAGSAAQSTVYYAKLNSNGSIDTWSTNANALPAGRLGHSSVIANGYVYVIGGSDGSGSVYSTVYYAKLNSDGSTGAWSTNANALPAVRYIHSSVIANGYVYVIGGNTGSATQSTVYYAKLNSDGSIGAWSTNANGLPAIRSSHSSVIANGYVYVIGGNTGGTSGVNTVYYAKLNSDGSTGAWSTNSNVLPVQLNIHSSAVANGYVYVLGGYTGGPTAARSTVYFAKLNSDGSTGAWSTNVNALPVGRQNHSSVIANGYVYVLGGTSGGAQSTIYYASTARISMLANLDLIGLASTTLADVNNGGSDGGSVGGSIFAGNIFSHGKLEVTNGAQIFGGVGINGLLSINATTSGTQTGSIFSIQNATGTQPIMTALYNGNVGIGTTSPSQRLAVHGNALFSGDLFLANLTATGTLTVQGVSTSTFSNGLDLSSGCFSINGTCIGGGISPSGGVLYADSGEVNSVGAGPDILRTYTLPANSLVAGKKIRIQVFGYHNDISGNKDVHIKWGNSSANIGFSQGGSADQEWTIDAQIYYVSATSQFAIIQQASGSQIALQNPYIRYSDVLQEDTTAPIVISLEVSSTSGLPSDIVNEAMIVELN